MTLGGMLVATLATWGGLLAAAGRAIGPDMIGKFEPSPCPSLLISSAMAVDRSRLQCGFVTVPERHAHPEGRTIKLAVAILKSRSDRPQPDPLVMAQGGPGGSTLMLLEPWWQALTSTPGLRDRDVVLIEQRGTQFSRPYLFCKEVYAVDRDISPKLPSLTEGEIDRRTREAYQACYERLTSEGVDLSAYNSLENADDLPLVMSSLGYGRFNFYGVSYGTRLAQHLMRRHPDRLRSVILDGVVPLETNYITESPGSHDRAIRQLFEQCRRSPVCRREYPDLPQLFQSVVAKLEREPLMTEVFDAIAYVDAQIQASQAPQTDHFNMLDLSISGKFWRPVAIDGDGLVDLTISALYDSSLIPHLPEWFREMDRGDWSSLSELASDWFSPIADGMQQSVLCAEEANVDHQSLSPPPDLLPELRSLINDPQEFLNSCQVWPVPKLPASVNEPVTSSIPTLLLSGNLDPVTPPPFGQRVADHLTRAYHYVFPGLGHGAFASSDCANGLVRDFLRDPQRAPDGRCVRQVQLIPQVPIVPNRFKPVVIWGTKMRSVVPADWRPDKSGLSNVWQAPRNAPEEGQITFMQVTDETLPQSIERLGLMISLTPRDSIQRGDRAWQLYANPLHPILVAAAVVDRDTYFVVLEGLRERSRRAVLDQILTQFRLDRAVALPPRSLTTRSLTTRSLTSSRDRPAIHPAAPTPPHCGSWESPSRSDRAGSPPDRSSRCGASTSASSRNHRPG
jgi:pimeloyl-ACP methyl ester carboxylesterase